MGFDPRAAAMAEALAALKEKLFEFVMLRQIKRDQEFRDHLRQVVRESCTERNK